MFCKKKLYMMEGNGDNFLNQHPKKHKNLPKLSHVAEIFFIF